LILHARHRGVTICVENTTSEMARLPTCGRSLTKRASPGCGSIDYPAIRISRRPSASASAISLKPQPGEARFVNERPQVGRRAISLVVFSTQIVTPRWRACRIKCSRELKAASRYAGRRFRAVRPCEKSCEKTESLRRHRGPLELVHGLNAPYALHFADRQRLTSFARSAQVPAVGACREASLRRLSASARPIFCTSDLLA